MSRLKRLIRESHQRSLWQALLIYLGASFAVLEAVALFRDEFGLPDWLLSVALVLLLFGLPVVVVTSLTKEEIYGDDVGEEHAAAAAEEDRRLRFLTWRAAGLSFAAALAVWGVVVALLLLLGGYGLVAPDDRPSIAVLPLENLSPDRDNEFFAAGIHEDILSQLMKIRALRVISRTSVLRYADTDKDIPTIAQELRVDGVLEGSVRRAGNQVRVVLQLIDKGDIHLWSETYDRNLTVANVFAIQSDIATQIARALEAELTPEERERIETSPTQNLEAYDFYLRGMVYWRQPGWDRELFRGAQRMWERAVEIDPGFAPAHAWLSSVHSLIYWLGHDHTSERLRQARAAADRALELDPDLPEAHLALANYYYWGFRAYDQALYEVSVAEQGLPGTTESLRTRGFIYRRQGRWEEATAELKRAAALDPMDSNLLVELGNTHLFLRRYDEAESCYEKALAIEPEFRVAAYREAQTRLLRDGELEPLQAYTSAYPGRRDERRWVSLLGRDYAAALDAVSHAGGEIIEGQEEYTYHAPRSLYAGLIHVAAGQAELAWASFDSARVMLETAVSERPDDPQRRRALGLAYAAIGMKEAAVREGRRAVGLMPMSKDSYAAPYLLIGLAQIHTMVGDYDAAVDQLDYVLSIPSDVSVPLLRIDPTWDPLREHPRFQALLVEYEEQR